MTMKVAELFVKCLEREGVSFVFALPGEENLALLEALRTSSIKVIVTRHEQAAGFMAATIGRLTGKPGVCLSTLGPGATNFVTAAAYAQLGGMPMLMITGQKPVKRAKQGHFQIVDTVQIFRPVTKFSKQIVSSENIPALVREAFELAEAERPGAVHLELPEDVADEEVDAEPFEPIVVRRAVADVKAVEQAVDLIKKAKRPLLLVGAGANRKQVANMLTEFIKHTGIPFFNTQMGKGVIDERHEKYLGTAALSDGDYVHCAISKADLIINVGHDTTEKPPFLMERNNGQQVIHINFYPAKTDMVYFPHCQVVGDIANALWQIKEQLAPQKHWDFSYFEKIRNLLKQHLTLAPELVRFPVTPQQLVAAVREVVPEQGIVSLDNGMYKIWFARNYFTYQSNTLLLDNALATMGAGLPQAMAAKLINPDRPVVAVCGDGGLVMSLGDLETAVRMKLNLTIVLVRDDGYGMIKWKQQGSGLSDFGLSFGNPDFVKLAESFGAVGHRVSSAEEFTPLFKKCLAESGVHIIDTPIDYSENDRVLNRELKEKTCLI